MQAPPEQCGDLENRLEVRLETHRPLPVSVNVMGDS